MIENNSNTVNPTQERQQLALSPAVATPIAEDKRVSRYLERKKNAAPKVNYTRLEDEGDPVTLLARYSEATGSVSDDFRDLLFEQLAPLVPPGIDRGAFLNAALSTMHGLLPKDELEGMVAAQLFCLHSLAMQTMGRARIAEDYGILEMNVKMVDKLLRAFRETVEILQRYRGKGSKQKVIVERVNVHQGGQAIVGAVNKDGGEGAH